MPKLKVGDHVMWRGTGRRVGTFRGIIRAFTAHTSNYDYCVELFDLPDGMGHQCHGVLTAERRGLFMYDREGNYQVIADNAASLSPLENEIEAYLHAEV